MGVSAIPVVLLLLSQVLGLLDISLDFTGLSNQLLAIVGTVVGSLALFGVVNDPTTSGTSDSGQALQYTEPKK